MVELDIPINMASEDFPYMLNLRPVHMCFLDKVIPLAHHPEYDFDDDISPLEPVGTQV